MQPNNNKTIGLIAGQGRLPFLIAKGAKNAGLDVACIGLAGSVSPELAEEVDFFYTVPLARLGNWIKKLKRHNVTDTIMVGRVVKTQIFTPWRILTYLPDWRAIRIWYWRLKKENKLNDSILCAIADELASGGIILEDSTMYCQEHLAAKGLMTKTSVSKSVMADIDFGWQIVKELGKLDIGQAIAVKDKEVLSVEAIEGTAAMIERTASLCKSGNWTLIKTAKVDQDMRFDVPCIGPDTINSLAKNGCKTVAVEAGKTIIIDKDDTIKLADELGLSIIGVDSLI